MHATGGDKNWLGIGWSEEWRQHGMGWGQDGVEGVKATWDGMRNVKYPNQMIT
jgi:hypothetical protein